MGQVGRPRKNPESNSPVEPVQQAEPQFENNPNQEYLAPTPELNPRLQILKEIAERSNLQADQDAAETIPVMDEDGNEIQSDDIETETESAAPLETPSTNLAPEAPDAPVVAADQFDPEKEYDLIVHGKPVKVKGSQIIEQGKIAFQKETAADQKLQKATQILEEAKAFAQAQKQTPPEPQLTDEELAQIIQFGTPEQATAAIKYIKGNPQAEQQKFQEMAKALPQVVSDQIAFHEAAAFVQSEYKDLLNDPYLKPIFFNREKELREAGDTRSYKELYKAIGDELRSHFNRPAPTTAKTMEEKREAKANAPAAPRLASARMESSPEKKPPTREEIIHKMQQARGQRPANTIN